MDTTRLTLCVVVCGAGPAADVDHLIRLAQGDGWTVFVVATPAALPFLDTGRLVELAGSEILSEHRPPSEPSARSAARASAVLVAPATFNTVNKLACGISDTYALAVLAEAVGMAKPVVMVPYVNDALAGRAPFRRSVEQLTAEGVTFVRGASPRVMFPWRDAFVAARNAVDLT